MTKPQKTVLLFILGLLIISSCASKKDLVYFTDVNLKDHDSVIFTESKIQTNDILSIIISSSAPDLSSIYNTNSPISNSNTASSFNGYLVTIDGTITLPVLGKLKVKDLTLLELENVIVKKLIDENHLANPTVTARITNAKFTILGEVKNPGTYTFNEQSISILQAIGYAGDLTIYGKRKDILIIREENNTKTYLTIDMTSKKWFNSPFYYIKPNDVIYVNPNDTKIKSSGYLSNSNAIIAIATLILSVLFLIKK